MLHRTLNFKSFFFILLFFFGTTFIHPLGWFIIPTFMKEYLGHWKFNLLINCSSYILMFLFTLIFVKKTEKLKNLRETFNFLGVKKKGLKEATFLGLIAILILTFPSIVLVQKFQLPWYWEEKAPLWYNYSKIVYLLTVAAPVEEIAYRGYVLKKLAPIEMRERKKKVVWIVIALFVSSILHAFWHLNKHNLNLLEYIQSSHFRLTILLGIIYGSLYLKSKNILGSSLVHAYTNIYPYSVILFSFLENPF